VCVRDQESHILGLVEANLLWREYKPNEDYIFLAESGSVLYCNNLATGKFEIVDRITKEPDDENDIFDTSQELLEKLFNHILGRYDGEKS
jgi:hypothetical protein